MSELTALTAFEVYYLEGRANYRLLFPAPMLTRRHDRSRSTVYFTPGTRVGYGRWRANEFGTQSWRGFVLRTLRPDCPAISVPGVSPGAEILLSIRGARRSKRFLAFIDALKKRGADPEKLYDSYWRQLHFALQESREPHLPSETVLAANALKRGVMK